MSSASASPWGVTTSAVPAKSLNDIMTEELLANEKSLICDENLDYIYNEEDFMSPEELAARNNSMEKSLDVKTSSVEFDVEFNEEDFMTDQEKADRDFALALAAQEEEYLRKQKKNPKCGNSKVNVCSSFDDHYSYGSCDKKNTQESSDNFAAKELDAMLMKKAGLNGISFRNGVANVDGIRISKHDALIDGLMNSKSIGEMDGSGDMCGLLLSNTVSNSLKSFAKKQKQKGVFVGGGRVSAKDNRCTAEGVLDEKTRLLLFKLIQKGIFDEVHGIIKSGKESNVYYAKKNGRDECNDIGTFPELLGDNDSAGDQESETSSSVTSWQSRHIFENSDLDYSDVAVKIFKTTLNEFGNRIDYVKGDHRFAKEKYAKNYNNKRKFISQWVEKEFRNLCRARAKGLNVPRPIMFKDNVLIMEMIVESKNEGEDIDRDSIFANSPQLKQLDDIPLELWESCYNQTLLIVQELYRKCKMVHADLSEYNLLLRNRDLVYAVDFGQAIDTSHPEHQKFLFRDIETVNIFFRKKGVNVRDSQGVLQAIVNS